MTETNSKQGLVLIVTVSLALCNLLYLGYSFLHVEWLGYLPPPYFQNHYDTYMDLYNTNFFSYQSTRYDGWRSVYPPLAFLVAKFNTSAQCVANSTPVELRECSPWSILLIYAAMVVGSIYNALDFCRTYMSQLDKKFIAFFSLVIATFLSGPSVFAIERGNYIVLCYALLSIAIYYRGHNLILAMLAVSVNIKPYLGVLILSYARRTTIYKMFMAFVLSAALFFSSDIVLGDKNSKLLLDNILGFANAENGNYLDKLYFNNSPMLWYDVLYYIVRTNMTENIFLQELIQTVIYTKFLLYVPLLILLRNIWNSKDVIFKCFALTLLLVTYLPSLGGYAILLLFPYFAHFAGVGKYKYLPWIIFALYLAPDMQFPVVHDYSNYSYFLDGDLVWKRSGLTLGSVLRPLILLLYTTYVSSITYEKN